MRSLSLLLLVACGTSGSPDSPPANTVTEPAPLASPDAGEGARAKREEGKVGRKDAAMERAPRDGTLLLIKGDDAGSASGLGSRGSGLGGGGTAQGIGGLGTRGIGSGHSGYGAGYGRGVARPAAVPSRETYTDPGMHETTLAADDALSTFSIDVDTAAYAIARSHLDGGSLPPRAAIRVEEFVNAQTYGYVPPGGEGPFAVNMEASPDPWHPGHHLLRVGIKAAEPEVDRAPVHLTFLVDTSGSMRADNKLPLAKRALAEMVKNLDGEDRVALVTYAGSTRVVLEPTRVSDRARILRAIDGLTHGGGTAMGTGMQLAYDMALKHLEPGTENRVVVLSDGDANIGATSHEQILHSLRSYAKQGITLSTVGFGRGNYQDTLMEQLADEGDGNYHYIDTMKEARKVFGTQLAATVQTVARDVKIQVEMNPESVISYRLIGYENRDIADADFRKDDVDAGEIGAGHAVTALYDVVLRDAPARELATVRIRSKVPGPDAPAIERTTTLPSSAVQPSFTGTTPDFRVAVGTAAFAEKLRGSPWTDELTYGAIADVLERAGRSDDAELIGLVRRAGALSNEQVAAR